MAPYAVYLSRSAVADMDRLRRYDTARIVDAMEKHLANEPTRETKTGIRRLRGISNPDYRLRVGAYRVFYSVDEAALRVDVLRVMHKDETYSYYEELEQ